jgi:hypothetical protein
MADDTDFSLFVLSTCAFCQKPGADAPFDPDHPDWAWVHRLCAEQPGRLEAIAQGKCFFCLEAGRDMTPYGKQGSYELHTTALSSRSTKEK